MCTWFKSLDQILQLLTLPSALKGSFREGQVGVVVCCLGSSMSSVFPREFLLISSFNEWINDAFILRTGQWRQCAHRTPATGWEERESKSQSSVWGLLGRHYWQGPVVVIWLGHQGYTPTLYVKFHGIFNDHRESGPWLNVSSERRTHLWLCCVHSCVLHIIFKFEALTFYYAQQIHSQWQLSDHYVRGLTN